MSHGRRSYRLAGSGNAGTDLLLSIPVVLALLYLSALGVRVLSGEAISVRGGLAAGGLLLAAGALSLVSRNWSGVLAGSLGFVGVRWAIEAVVSHDRNALAPAIAGLAAAVLLARVGGADDRKRAPSSTASSYDPIPMSPSASQDLFWLSGVALVTLFVAQAFLLAFGWIEHLYPRRLWVITLVAALLVFAWGALQASVGRFRWFWFRLSILMLVLWGGAILLLRDSSLQ
jgi:hypothetical protein